MTTPAAGASSEAVATEHEHDWVVTRDASTRCRICGINKRYATPTAPAVVAEPSDEQIRAAFRDYDARTGSPTHNTAWQSWRDACKWLLALRQGTAAPASVPAVSEPSATPCPSCPFPEGCNRRGECRVDYNERHSGQFLDGDCIASEVAIPTDPKASALEKDAARWRMFADVMDSKHPGQLASARFGRDFMFYDDSQKLALDLDAAIASTSEESGHD